jgi:hypothetical protein
MAAVDAHAPEQAARATGATRGIRTGAFPVRARGAYSEPARATCPARASAAAAGATQPERRASALGHAELAGLAVRAADALDARLSGHPISRLDLDIAQDNVRRVLYEDADLVLGQRRARASARMEEKSAHCDVVGINFDGRPIYGIDD